MTAAEWTAYGDACAAHEDVTIDGVEYRTIDRPWMPDLKTGTSFSWCAVAMQLASYANVDADEVPQ